jgi:hypothetical protein
MKLVMAIFGLAVLTTATISIGFSLWDGRQGHNDAALRAIHYDTNYDLSAQRRIPADRSRSE